MVGTFVDVVLGFAKVIVGFLFHSHALIIDGIHSFSDVVTDIFVIVINKFTHEAPDEEHPYGHGVLKTLGTLALGLSLFAAAGALACRAVHRLITVQDLPAPTWPVILVAGASLVSKEVIYQYTKHVGEKIN